MPAAQRILQGPPRTVERLGLDLGHHARRVLRHAPVIEHLGHVVHACLLRGAQHEVVILGAVELRAKRAHLVQKRTSHDEQVGYVVVRQQKIGREIGLEVRVDVAPVGRDEVLVRVEDVGVVRGDGQHHLVERVLGKLVVVVHERNVVAAGHGNGVVRGTGNVLVAVEKAHVYSRIMDAPEAIQGLLARRAIVNDAQLPVPVELAFHRLDRRLEPTPIGVEDRHDDADLGFARESLDPRAGTVAVRVAQCVREPVLLIVVAGLLDAALPCIRKLAPSRVLAQ